MQCVNNTGISAPEKYTRVVTFNYIAKGLRKDGYDVNPMKMPEHLKEMVDRKLKAEFYGNHR
jgi:hypothetical protein